MCVCAPFLSVRAPKVRLSLISLSLSLLFRSPVLVSFRRRFVVVVTDLSRPVLYEITGRKDEDDETGTSTDS